MFGSILGQFQVSVVLPVNSSLSGYGRVVPKLLNLEKVGYQKSPTPNLELYQSIVLSVQE